MELSLLAEKAPEAYRALMEQKVSEQKHRQRFAWVDLIAQTVGHLCGLASLSILALVSWHAFDRDAPTQGAAIICTGAVSIVAVFVTGRVAGGRKPPKR
jgi:hypothetical protein